MLALNKKGFKISELLNPTEEVKSKISSDPQNKMFYRNFLKFKISPYSVLLE